MPSEIRFPLINGKRPDFASIQWQLQDTNWPAGVPIGGFRSISYEESSSGTEAMGAVRTPIGLTTGQVTFNGSFEVYKDEWNAMCAALALLDVGYMEAMFNMTFTYVTPFNVAPGIDQLIGVMLRKASDNHQQGGEALVVRVDFQFMNISRNLISPMGSVANLAKYSIPLPK